MSFGEVGIGGVGTGQGQKICFWLHRPIFPRKSFALPLTASPPPIFSLLSKDKSKDKEIFLWTTNLPFPLLTRRLPVAYPKWPNYLPSLTRRFLADGRRTALYCNRRRKGKAARKVRSLPVRFRIRKKEEKYMTEARRKNTVRKRGDEHKSVRLEYGKTVFRNIYGTVTWTTSESKI